MNEKPNRYDSKANIIAPAPQLPTVARPMSEAESNALQGLTQNAMHPQPIQTLMLPPATHTAHMKETHDVRAAARVAERFVVWDMAIFGTITAALAGLIYYRVGGDTTIYALGWLVIWGGMSFVAMYRNRGQSYDHSPTGVARLEQRTQAAMHDRSAQVQEYEIDSRERIALHAIDRHAELIQARWRLGDGDQ